MKRRVLLEKRVGETPLHAIERWKEGHQRYRDVPASYAGRLDPMASGKLLVLLGDECKRQKEYTKLDKVYDVEVLLDIGSDTGDVLGIVASMEASTFPTRRELAASLAQELGTHERPYPAYSSKTVNGKPLFLHALLGNMETIEVPTHLETIHRIRLRGLRRVSSSTLGMRVASLLALAPVSDEPSKALGADFRIKDVRASWERALTNERDYSIIRLRIRCGSGAYMRSLAERIGAALGTRALALSIHRKRIVGV